MVGSGVVAAGSRRGAYSYSITSARLPSFSSREKGPLTALLGWERPIAGLGAPPVGTGSLFLGPPWRALVCLHCALHCINLVRCVALR